MPLGWTVFRILRFVVPRFQVLVTLLWQRSSGMPLWSFVRRPFPPLGEQPILARSDATTTPPTVLPRAMMLWYYAFAPFVTVMLCGVYFRHVVSGRSGLNLARRDFAAFGQASNLAAFSGPKGSGNRDRGSPSPGRSAGDFQPLVAHHPGARTVYRRGNLRSRGVGENQRLA